MRDGVQEFILDLVRFVQFFIRFFKCAARLLQFRRFLHQFAVELSYLLIFLDNGIHLPVRDLLFQCRTLDQGTGCSSPDDTTQQPFCKGHQTVMCRFMRINFNIVFLGIFDDQSLCFAHTDKAAQHLVQVLKLCPALPGHIYIQLPVILIIVHIQLTKIRLLRALLGKHRHQHQGEHIKA